MPAGVFLKYRSNIPEYSKYVFNTVDSTFPERCLSNKAESIANIIVGGESYGQGSSREHAALCPMYLGVKAVVARSMERIHKANLINFGIVPLLFASEADYDSINQDDTLELPDVKSHLQAGENLVLRNLTKGEEYSLKYELTERQKTILFAGGMLNSMKR